MNIMFVSRSWLSHERSGVTFSVATHIEILVNLGHSISILGSHPDIVSVKLPVNKIYYIKAHGSGSIYSPAYCDCLGLEAALSESSPDIVIIEGWQTALTTSAIKISKSLGLRILMVSHGSSILPFTSAPIDLLRSIAWLPYKWFVLPRLIAKANVITTLSLYASSDRFFDRDMALRLGKLVVPLINTPANKTSIYKPRNQRIMQILVVGYFSGIKNQIQAIKVASRLEKNLIFRFVGKKEGFYYKRCVSEAAELGVKNRIIFTDDTECNLADEISKSILVFMPSKTEVLPLTLLEAMASGTPFVASPVGAIPLLQGGINASGVEESVAAIRLLISSSQIWQEYSEKGRDQYLESFTYDHVKDQLVKAIELTTKISTNL